MANPITGVVQRLGEWWTRASWGWLVILGPIIIYGVLNMSLDFVGLGAANPYSFTPENTEEVYRSGDALALYSIGARLEYTLVASLWLLVAAFSIIWSLPRIACWLRNPFGGFTGLLIAIGLTAALYSWYHYSSYNLRIVFADRLLRHAHDVGVLEPIVIDLWVTNTLGFSGLLRHDQLLSYTRDIIYIFGNFAPWAMIVLAACCASFEPRTFRQEPPESLRRRMTLVQIAVMLAAANIVLNVAYTRSMVSWPPELFVDEIGQDFSFATNRYVALWGAVGTMMLVTALAPAYVSLMNQFDRVANLELSQSLGRAPTHRERMEWRVQHGLVVSAQQALTTGVAVIAPIMTSPTLDASTSGDSQRSQNEIRLNANQR